MNFKQNFTMIALAALAFASLGQASEPVQYKKWITDIEQMLKASTSLSDKEIALINARLDSLDKLISKGPRKERIARARQRLNDTQAKRSTSAGTSSAASAAAPAQKSQQELLLDNIASTIQGVESLLDAAAGEGVDASDQKAILDDIDKNMADYGAMIRAAGMTLDSIRKSRANLANRIDAVLARFDSLRESLKTQRAGTIVVDMPEDAEEEEVAAPGGASNKK